MPTAARTGDLHACPSHSGGPVTGGSATVRIGGAPAARVGDQSKCGGSVDTIVQGSPTVFIEGRPAARTGDRCEHRGVIVTGCPTVVIGNVGSATGGGASGGAKGLEEDAGAAGTGGADKSKISPQVVNGLVSVARQLFAGAAGSATQTAIQGAATALEVAAARSDTGAIAEATSRLQELLQKRGQEEAAPDEQGGPEAPADAAAPAAGPSHAPALGWQTRAVPADPPRTVAVAEGRVKINGQFAGLHAISEFDLIELQAAGRIPELVQRIIAASAAGRNCARVFAMYAAPHGQLSPWKTAGYWTAVDTLIRRLTAYGMLGEFVLFADCEPRPDGTGGTMASWQDRRAFAREAGQFFRSKPVIVCGMDDPARNGADGAGDPRLLEIMAEFRDASGGTVPFSIADPAWTGDEHLGPLASAEEALAAAGASLVVVHAPRQAPNGGRYRAWIDRLKEFGAVRDRGLSGNPYLYHSRPMGFAARREEGRRENDPEAAVAAACVSAVWQMGFCYHRVAREDPATPGLDLARVATLIPQSPGYKPFAPGASGGPIESANDEDFAGGGISTCFNGVEAWAVGYARKLPKSPRVTWRALTPQEIWRGERVVLWHAT